MTSDAVAVPWKVRRARAVTRLREAAEARLPKVLTDMSRRDRARWASARSLADLGELVIAWLHGEIIQTPGHCGPPDPETIPLIPWLTAINRGGFVTDNSQLAEITGEAAWGTDVSGFASGEVLEKIRAAVAGTELKMGACRGGVHGCWRGRWNVPPCPRRATLSFWTGRCPDMGDELRHSWWVHIEDPEPGRNNLLWPVLRAALGEGK
jgi:hypothetical protein